MPRKRARARVPEELVEALAHAPQAQCNWGAVAKHHRITLSGFVAGGWLRRTRRHRAALVARVCAAGPEAVESWLSDWTAVTGVFRRGGGASGGGPPYSY